MRIWKRKNEKDKERETLGAVTHTHTHTQAKYNRHYKNWRDCNEHKYKKGKRI